MDEWTASEKPKKPENKLIFQSEGNQFFLVFSSNNSDFGFSQREKCLSLVTKAKTEKLAQKIPLKRKLNKRYKLMAFSQNGYCGKHTNKSSIVRLLSNKIPQ